METKVLKFESLSPKCQIDQNAAYWVQNYETIKMLKFEDEIGNSSKCWNLHAKCQIQLNVENQVQNSKWIRVMSIEWKSRNWKMLKFWDKTLNQCWNFSSKCQVNDNVVIWVENIKWIKMLKFEAEIDNRSKC